MMTDPYLIAFKAAATCVQVQFDPQPDNFPLKLKNNRHSSYVFARGAIPKKLEWYPMEN